MAEARGHDDEEVSDNRTWSRRFSEPPEHVVIAPPRPQIPPADSHRGIPAAPRRRYPKKGLVVASIAVVMIVMAAVVAVVTTGTHQPSVVAPQGLATAGSSGSQAPGSAVAAAAYVVSSTQSTLRQDTADVTISGNVSAQGQTASISGGGYVNFDRDAFSADLTINSASGPIDEQEIVIGGQIYLAIGAQGFDIADLAGGANWVDVPVPDQDSSELGAGNMDPQAQLLVLEQPGATVSPLGTSTVEGENVSGYSVTTTEGQVQQTLQQEVRSGAVPASALPLIEQELEQIGTPTMRVYYDNSDLLSILSVTLGGGASPVSASVQMTFDDYGTTVHIAPPVRSDVVSYAQFLQDVQASQPPAV